MWFTTAAIWIGGMVILLGKRFQLLYRLLHPALFRQQDEVYRRSSGVTPETFESVRLLIDMQASGLLVVERAFDVSLSHPVGWDVVFYYVRDRYHGLQFFQVDDGVWGSSHLEFGFELAYGAVYIGIEFR